MLREGQHTLFTLFLIIFFGELLIMFIIGWSLYESHLYDASHIIFGVILV